MIKRRRFKQSQSLQNRLLAFARDTRAEAEALPHGLARDQLIKKARQAQTASHLDQWLGSPGLQTPK